MNIQDSRFIHHFKNNMKISNVDSLSALLDRLITERIKHYFFVKDGDEGRSLHQEYVISQLKIRISETFEECLNEHKYDVLQEKRTFSLNDITQEIDNLVESDINVGEYDRLALEGAKKNSSILMNAGIVGFRTANENRSKSKNLIDTLFQKLFRS